MLPNNDSPLLALCPVAEQMDERSDISSAAVTWN